MTLRRKLLDVWATGKSGVAIATLLGLLILLLRTPLERWSYDLPYLIRPQATISEVAIVHLDDVSHQALNQPYDGAWDRTNHAELVEVLTEAGARAIAFDILFNDEGRNPAANLKFANAVRKNGKVVLASDLGTGDYYAYAIDLRPMLPNSTLLAATPYYGFDQLMPDPDDCIRRHLHDVATIQSLSWSLATMLNAEVTKHPGSASEERWLNYYGPRDTIPHLSYAQALNRNDPAVKDFFRNRVVFIGSAT
ncbi:MAG TPA: CHASE2 domain-containing protein, partial [Verrucomicrobiae bacterium]